MDPRMDFDDAAWERSEDIADSWIHNLFADEDTLRAIGRLIVKYRKGVADE